MPYQEYHNEGDPSHTEATVPNSHRRYVIESLTKHATSKAKGVKTQVTEHISKQPGGCVVSLPEAWSDVFQRVTVNVAEKEYPYG